MTATVLRAGFLTTVQDLGRAGLREFGVSVGGAADPHAFAVANLLVGNDPGCAGLEVTAGQVRIRCADERIIAWCGGAYAVTAGEVQVDAGRPAVVPAGEEIRIASEGGARACLALSGGIDVPQVLGSRSTDLRSRFGGLSGRALVAGDVLQLGAASFYAEHLMSSLREARVADYRAPAEWASPQTGSGVLRFVRGADWHRFEAESQRALTATWFQVSAEADRMGVRLEAAELKRVGDACDLISEAVTPGTLQVPPSGQPILLLPDCQTIGGYSKIAHVITVDLPIAA